MGSDRENQPKQPSLRSDPRLYQIGSLSVLLLYGFLFLHFDVSTWQIIVTPAAALLTQYAATRYFQLPSFDPKSALISSLSLCLLLRADNPATGALAALVAIASKFVIRWKDKHLFNPTNFALVVMLSNGLGWISPGQWGQVAWFGFLITCLGSLVVTRAARVDVTLAFLFFYVGLLFSHAMWLGDVGKADTKLLNKASEVVIARHTGSPLCSVRFVSSQWTAVGADRLCAICAVDRLFTFRRSLRLVQTINRSARV